VLREKVARARIVSRLANVPPCLIGIEAGMGTHYVTRELLTLGHDVRQVPPVYAKPFRQTHKNDFRDALAIAEAVNVPRRGAYRRKRTNSSISRHCIVCVTAWWGNGPRPLIKSAAFS
jgi:transposase